MPCMVDKVIRESVDKQQTNATPSSAELANMVHAVLYVCDLLHKQDTSKLLKHALLFSAGTYQQG